MPQPKSATASDKMNQLAVVRSRCFVVIKKMTRPLPTTVTTARKQRKIEYQRLMTVVS